MKRHKLIPFSIIVVLGITMCYSITALGQSPVNPDQSALENTTFSNQPIDHRYRLLLNERDEAASLAIAQRYRYQKEELIRILIEKARKYDLEPALVVAIATQESRLDPYARSHMGAMGLMQLMPATARRFGVKNILDPRQNADGGTRYFRYLMNEFNGQVELALAAYNAGSAPVLQYNAIPPFAQTQTFVEKVLEFREHYRQVIK